MGSSQREYYYECDTGLNGRRLRQSSLSDALNLNTMGDTEDTNTPITSDDTVGQGEDVVQGAGIN